MALIASGSQRRGTTGLGRAPAILLACALEAPAAVGCGGPPPMTTEPSTAPTTGGEVVERARIEALETEAARRERRIRELESRLALADAEVRELRHEAEQREDDVARDRSRDIVRIGAPASPESAEEVEVEADDGPRPVLRLYGDPAPPPLMAYQPPDAASGAMGIARPLPAATLPTYLQAPPPALGQLPVVAMPGSAGVPPIPDRPISVLPAPPAAPSIAPRGAGTDAVVREYQHALGHVAARRFDEALGALDAFLRAHPQHPYADNAMYWRAEVRYAQRDYAGAERELLEMLRRYPRGNKVPDALLRLGFCRQRQGDVEGARVYFRRVRAEYPGTIAARLASREDT